MNQSSPAAAFTPRKRTPLISMKNVSKNYKAVRALAGVDLEVYPGEVVAIVGDNAAGKSTLINILAGVITPDGGTIEMDGVPINITSPSSAQALGIATVFQELALADNLSIVNNLFLGREYSQRLLLQEYQMEQEAVRLFRQLKARMPSIKTLVSDLSGGQKQNVAIARCMLGNPRVILLDEPTAALSVSQSAEVLNLIEGLRDRGLGVVLISHNLGEVHAVADRIAVLRLGQNNGTFHTTDTTYESILALITGAMDIPRDRDRS